MSATRKTKLQEQIQRLFTCGYNEQDWTSCDYLFIYVNCNNTWFVDYGASKHLTFWKGIFSTFEEFALGHKVYIGNNDILDIYVKKALLFLICQMECPNAFEMYPKVGKKYIIGKSINKTRFQGQIWNQKMLVEVFIFEQGGCSSYLSVDL